MSLTQSGNAVRHTNGTRPKTRLSRGYGEPYQCHHVLTYVHAGKVKKHLVLKSTHTCRSRGFRSHRMDAAAGTV